MEVAKGHSRRHSHEKVHRDDKVAEDFRSPLREDEKKHRPRGRYDREKKEWKSRDQMSGWRTEEENPHSKWQSISKQENGSAPSPLSESDFPSLQNVRNNSNQRGKRSFSKQFSPPAEDGCNKWSKKHENSCSGGRQRKLSPQASPTEETEEEERVNRVREEIQKLKGTQKLDDQGFRLKKDEEDNENKERKQYETDEEVILRRQKQVDYGKRTEGYQRYLKLVPKRTRSHDHPRTPHKFGKFSRRAWDTRVRLWRRLLHHYDPQGSAPCKDDQGSSSGSRSVDGASVASSECDENYPDLSNSDLTLD